MATPILCIHGGLGSEKGFKAKFQANQEAIRRIAEKGRTFLEGHTAMESVVYLTQLLEDEPLFNAGTGSTIQSDGVVRMSASVMDGSSHIFSGVMNIERVQHPIDVAAALQEEKDRVLAALPARRYAQQLGLPDYDPETRERREEFEHRKAQSLLQAAKRHSKPSGTVGAVVLDGEGRLAAATSTGGKGWEIPGRVGDSPTIAGNYATPYCAISATGCGEDIISVGLACAFATRVGEGMPLPDARQKALHELALIKGSAGFIALNASGESIIGATSPALVWARASAAGIETFA